MNGANIFFDRGEGLSVAEIAILANGQVADPATAERRVSGLASLDEAGPDDLGFFDNPKYAGQLAVTAAGCVILASRFASMLPKDTAGILAANPQQAFAAAGRALFPRAIAPEPVTAESGIAPNAHIDPSAVLEEDVVVEPFAVIGPHASIGRGTLVGCGAVVGPHVQIGRDCRIGPQSTVTHAFLGNRVIIHPGVRIGQDGFGYSAGPQGITKMVQVGRVIIQDDVEIGANTTVDRGAVRDTVIGEGAKIDNQVQIAHNVRIGRNCLIVSQVGISGSVTIGDGVMVGGQTGFNGHVTVGDGAQIAAVSTVADDVPAGARWGGTPARPVRLWFREMAMLREMAKAGRGKDKS